MKVKYSGYQPTQTEADTEIKLPRCGSEACRESTLEERNGWLQDENNRLINEIQHIKSDNSMLKETIVKLVMKMVGETE